MSDLPNVPAGLQAWMAGVERQLRDLAVGNPLNMGSVQDASGNSVPMSNLAFGQVVANNAAFTTLTGVVGGGGTINGTDATPSVVVYVGGGRLRTDISAELTVNSGGALNATMTMSAMCKGPYPDAASAAAGGSGAGILTQSASANLVNDQERDQTGGWPIATLGAGTWGINTGLARGYYLVTSTYSFTYDGTGATQGPVGQARRRYLSAQPY